MNVRNPSNGSVDQGPSGRVGTHRRTGLQALLLALLHYTEAGKAALALSDGAVFQALGNLPGAHACLALAIAGAGWANALQLAWYLRRAGVYARQPGWGKFSRQITLASAAMIAVLLLILWQWQQWTTWLWWERAGRLAILVGAGALAYAAMLWLQGLRLRDLRSH